MNALTDKLNELEQAIAQLQQAGPQAAAEVRRLTERLARLRDAAANATPTRPGPGPATAVMPASAPSPARMPGVPAGGEQPGGLGGRSGPVPVAIVSSVPVDVRLLGGLGQQRQNAEASYYFSRQASQQANAAVQVRAMQQAPLSVVRIESPLPLPVTGQGRPEGDPYAADRARQVLALEGRRFAVMSAGSRPLADQARLYSQMRNEQTGINAGLIRGDAGQVGESAKRSTQSLKGLADAITTMWQRGSAAFAALAAAGDPFATWPTYKASIESLSASIGGELAPYVDIASYGIQRLTSYFDSLGGTTKHFAALGVVGVQSLAGLASSGFQAAVVFRLMKPELVVVGGWLLRVGSAALSFITSPWTLAIAGVAAVAGGVGYLAYQWYQSANAATEAKRAYEQAGSVRPGGDDKDKDKKAPPVVRFGPEDLAKVPPQYRKQLLEAGPDNEKAVTILKKYQAEAEAEKVKAEKGAAGAVAGGTDLALKASAILEKAGKELWDDAFVLKRQIMTDAGLGLRDRMTPAATKKLATEAEPLIDARTKEAMKELAPLLPRIRQQPGYEEFGEKDIRMRVARGLIEQPAKAFVSAKGEVINSPFAFPQNQDKFAEANLRKLRAEALMASELVKKIGLTPATSESIEAERVAAARGGSSGLKRAYGNLPEPQILTSTAYADQIQVAALKSGDLRDEVANKQLGVAEASDNKLEALKTTLDNIFQRLNFPPQFRY